MKFLDWLFQRKKQEHIADISSKLWEKLSLNFIKSKFAESNDSMKYVVDISTNRVVWINYTIQKQFGNVVGEKCHEAFHNSEMPCSFCTNQFLQEGVKPMNIKLKNLKITNKNITAWQQKF